MTKSLERASKLLALAGIALLMWTGAQTASAQVAAPVPFSCTPIYGPPSGYPTGCQNGYCPPGKTCAFYPANVGGAWICCV